LVACPPLRHPACRLFTLCAAGAPVLFVALCKRIATVRDGGCTRIRSTFRARENGSFLPQIV
jgi:hypothetical protein